nr:hypothetical protein [Corynebacterium pseudotuberculosis]
MPLNIRVFRRSACALALCGLLGVTACGNDRDDPAQAATETSSESAAETTTPTASSARETSQSVGTGTVDAGTAETSSEKTKKNPNLEKARKQFAALAPKDFFDQFDSCDANGVQNSMACSGEKIGQFQFFKSDSKAASTTQLLTELRSSRVVEDTGRRVVGWSTLGSTAVITVVDNDEGLVMQQMVSTDEKDPAEQIYALGLAQRPQAESSARKPPPIRSLPKLSLNCFLCPLFFARCVLAAGIIGIHLFDGVF